MLVRLNQITPETVNPALLLQLQLALCEQLPERLVVFDNGGDTRFKGQIMSWREEGLARSVNWETEGLYICHLVAEQLRPKNQPAPRISSQNLTPYGRYVDLLMALEGRRLGAGCHANYVQRAIALCSVLMPDRFNFEFAS